MRPTYKKKSFANRIKGIHFIRFESKGLLPSSTKPTYKESILRSVQKGKHHLLHIKKIRGQGKIKQVAERRDEGLTAPNQIIERKVLCCLEVSDTTIELDTLEKECIAERHKKITECQNKIDRQLEEIKESERKSYISTQNDNEFIYNNIVESIKDLNIG